MKKSFVGIKLMWAKKLVQAKYFVVMTDKESAICFEGADPNTFTDIMALTSQAAELYQFQASLDKLVKAHEAALAKLTGGTSDNKTTATATKPSTRSKKVKK